MNIKPLYFLLLTLLTSFFSIESSYNIFAISKNNFSMLFPSFAEVSKNISNLLFSLISFPCSKVTSLLYFQKDINN